MTSHWKGLLELRKKVTERETVEWRHNFLEDGVPSSPGVNVLVYTKHLTFVRVIGYNEVPKEHKQFILP